MDTIAQMQAILDEHGQQMPDNVYLELSNLTRSLYSQVNEMASNQAAQAGRRVQEIAPSPPSIQSLKWTRPHA